MHLNVFWTENHHFLNKPKHSLRAWIQCGTVTHSSRLAAICVLTQALRSANTPLCVNIDSATMDVCVANYTVHIYRVIILRKLHHGSAYSPDKCAGQSEVCPALRENVDRAVSIFAVYPLEYWQHCGCGRGLCVHVGFLPKISLSWHIYTQALQGFSCNVFTHGSHITLKCVLGLPFDAETTCICHIIVFA